DEVMTPEVYTVDEDTDLGIVARRMLEANVKRFPVMRGEQVVGIVSRHDLVKVIARTDEDIQADVQRGLAEEGMRLTSLQVRVRGGVVELIGDRQSVRLAEILARSVPGVLEVRLMGSGLEPLAGRRPSCCHSVMRYLLATRYIRRRVPHSSAAEAFIGRRMHRPCPAGTAGRAGSDPSESQGRGRARPRSAGMSHSTCGPSSGARASLRAVLA